MERPVRLPRLRLRLRGLMIAVAIIGLLLGGSVALQRRSLRFKQLARYHAQGALLYARHGSGMFHDDTTCAEFREQEYSPSPNGQHYHPIGGFLTKRDGLWLRYHEQMAGKYVSAAESPWLPIAPDPPPPPGPDRPDR